MTFGRCISCAHFLFIYIGIHLQLIHLSNVLCIKCNYYEFAVQTLHQLLYIMQVYITVYGKLHFFFVEQERPRGNHGREGRKDRVLTHDTQRWLLISSSSLDENPSISNLPNFTSMHSLMTFIFHLSSFLTGWYSMLLIPTSLS